MKLLHKMSEYGKNIHMVELGPEDAGKTDDEMITAADNYCQYGKLESHFGGTVERLPGGQAKITVYTD